MLLSRRVPQRGPESLFLNLSGFQSRLALGAKACAGLAEMFVRRLLRRTFGSWYQHLHSHSPSMEGEIMQLEQHSDTAAFDPIASRGHELCHRLQKEPRGADP